MAAVGTVLSVAQTLFAAIESPIFEEIRFVFGYRSELYNLKNTVSTVRSVLLDAQAKQDDELSNEAHNYIEKLKYAVYDADDLLDMFTTMAAQKQQLEGGKFSREVRAFFSRRNQLCVAYTMSSGIKEIRKTLDAITRDHARFGISLAPNVPVRRRNKETCSWVNEKDIVGRENDKKVVIDMLLDPKFEGSISFVCIVGTGGVGKTALAQLVYNDTVIESAFPLRMWVCVSDQDPKHLDIKAVLCKILESATEEKPKSSELEWVQNQLRKVLEGKKYLLVLDDVWIEDRSQCLELGGYLMGGQKGSRIFVTTRSKMTTKVIGSGGTFELQGLSEENSWHLFERLAFEQGKADLDLDLVEIGKQIVKRCANVPLAIRMMGTLLYGRSKTDWEAIQRRTLAKIRQNGNHISDVLKLSYYHLDAHLKSCFSYCAVFPKDFVMEKMKLISLWIAQGYLEPFDESESLMNVGEECFSILMGRCFFQDVKTDEYGEIVSCKMHDLMHDIAQEIAGNEICNAYSITSNVNKQARHVFAVEQECAEFCFPRSRIRTYLKDSYWGSDSPLWNAILTKWKYLRALNLQNSGIKKLPSAIGKLLHLRYLDLSCNEYLRRLPEEITKLYNLQTLLLKKCYGLKELPSDLTKLAMLSVLDIEGCDGLKYMPCGLNKLTDLCILTLFVVGEVESSNKKKGVVGRLEDIADLNELKGQLTIKIKTNGKTYVKGNDNGGFLKRKEHINKVELYWLQDEIDENKIDSDKALAEELQPNRNLKTLHFSGYKDVEKPSWAIDDKLQASLPNLVELAFEKCKGLKDLPMLGRLRFLKSLRVEDLTELEYMENGSSSSYGKDEAISGEGFFPSLEVLWLEDLPNLKGWWREDRHMDISFPHLRELWIEECPLLTSVPLCPTIERLSLNGFNERLKIMKIEGGSPQPKLSRVETDDLRYLKSLSIPTALGSLSCMSIDRDKKLEDLREVEDIFRSCSSSLQLLSIWNFSKLRSTSGALEHLTHLQELYIRIDDQIIDDDVMRSTLEEEDEVPWGALHQNLCELRINYIPRGIRHLTSLQTLILIGSSHVEIIPEWISSLSSLRHFHIRGTSEELRRRCKSPDGEDWPKIQHISRIDFC